MRFQKIEGDNGFRPRRAKPGGGVYNPGNYSTEPTQNRD
jgi:hypothetical protein